jgi:hypothetical protein
MIVESILIITTTIITFSLITYELYRRFKNKN